MAPKPKIPKRTLLGAILILVGLAMFLVPSLSPASIFMETKELHASPNQLVTVRYGYTNEGTTQEGYIATINRDDIIMGAQEFILQPSTIFTGIVDFYAPPGKGRYIYRIEIHPETQKGSYAIKSIEEQTFTLVVK